MLKKNKSEMRIFARYGQIKVIVISEVQQMYIKSPKAQNNLFFN